MILPLPLRNNRMIEITINKHISATHLALVHKAIKFLNDDRTNIEAGEEFVYATIPYKILNGIVRRPKNSDPSTFVYEVLTPKIIGKGGFSTVTDVKGTLVIQDDDSLMFKVKAEHKRRVSKLYNLREVKPRYIKSEYERTKHLTHLKTKYPVKISQNNRANMVIFQRKQPGIELFKLLKTIHRFSLQDRFTLAMALLQALGDQVHDKGLLHRDIKPSNIIVHHNPQTRQFQVAIIDYNLSCPINSPTGSRVGTRRYMPKEAWLGKHDTSSDLFSMALIIGMIFGANAPIHPRARSANTGYESQQSCDNRSTHKTRLGRVQGTLLGLSKSSAKAPLIYRNQFRSMPEEQQSNTTSFSSRSASPNETPQKLPSPGRQNPPSEGSQESVIHVAVNGQSPYSDVLKPLRAPLPYKRIPLSNSAVFYRSYICCECKDCRIPYLTEQFNGHYAFVGLLDAFPGLSQKYQDELLGLLQSMTAEITHNRPSLEEALDALLVIQRKISTAFSRLGFFSHPSPDTNAPSPGALSISSSAEKALILFDRIHTL